MTLLRSHFRTEFDAKNAGNGVSRVQISKPLFFGGGGGMPPGPPTLRGASKFSIMLQSDF
jgi:hypothetical protein